MTGDHVERLIRLLARLPGLGQRSARRIALYLIRRRETVLLPLAEALHQVGHEIRVCSHCGNFDLRDPCVLCSDSRRDRSLLCVVEQVGDLWAIERTRAFHGLYHVLGGTLSALDGIGPDELNIAPLVERVRSGEITEVILALNATVEGQTTAHLILDRLRGCAVTLSRLAQGVPLGGELDHLDDGTLTAALKARRPW